MYSVSIVNDATAYGVWIPSLQILVRDMVVSSAPHCLATLREVCT